MANESAATGCIACGSTKISTEWGITSAFFARRALLQEPRPVSLSNCLDCQTRHFDIAASDEELDRLYADYRGETYFRQRNKLEPWYTRRINEDIGGEIRMRLRRQILADSLRECGYQNAFKTVLDHGGDRGQMLLDVQADIKAVYEISGVAPEPCVVAIDRKTMINSKWDLILSCHVLEHLPSPPAYVAELVSLGQIGTVYFFEVPDEAFKNFNLGAGETQKNWLSWLVKKPRMLMIFDFLSTAMRIKLRILPPFFFVALREHLTAFSVNGLSRLLTANGLDISSVKVRASGHIAAIAVKR